APARKNFSPSSPTAGIRLDLPVRQAYAQAAISPYVLGGTLTMIPKGAYYPNYGDPVARQPGQNHGDWWVADCGSIGMGVLAVAVRTENRVQKARYMKSVRSYADLVIKDYLGKNGGVTDGIWSEFSGEWWSSTAIFGGFLYLLYEETKEAEYLRVANGAMDWMLRHDFRKTEHPEFEKLPAGVVFYTFEFYAEGLKYLQPGSRRRKTAETQINDALQWMAKNQKGRGAKNSLNYFGDDTYMAGMPYLMYAFARQMPEHRDQIAAADQELNYLTGLLLTNSDPPVTRLTTWEFLSWTLMSYAERLGPGTILRASKRP
ncbi:MAG: hypothetical protein WBL72_14930, partial [Thermoguttaceae bacterium]